MITLKYPDPNSSKIEEQEFETIKEAIDFDYELWLSIGTSCNFFYNDVYLNIDTIHLSKEEVEKRINEEIISIKADENYKEYLCIEKKIKDAAAIAGISFDQAIKFIENYK